MLTLLALAWWAGASFALLAVALAWGGLHLIAHRRFWHSTFRDLRRTRRRHELQGIAMSNILTARITIVGTRPLLWHSFGLESIPLTKQERTGVAGNDPEEWRRSVIAAPDGRLLLPGTYFFGTLRDGARYTRKGRGTLQSGLVATLEVLDERAPLIDRWLPDPISTDPAQPIYLDVRSVKNPTTKGRNVRYRVAASPGWRVAFSIAWDKTILSRGEIEAVAHDAGRLAGIGSGRQIGLGRFAVEDFAIVREH